MPPLKLLTFSRTPLEEEAALPLVDALYHAGVIEGLALTSGASASPRPDNPLIHRTYEEYSLTPPRLEDPEWLLKAIQRALLEERAQVAIFPNLRPPYDQAVEFCRTVPGLRTLVWPDQGPIGAGEWAAWLCPAPDAVGPLTPEELASARAALVELAPEPAPTLLAAPVEKLLRPVTEWLARPAPPSRSARVPWRGHPHRLALPHLPALAALLPPGRALVLGDRAPEADPPLEAVIRELGRLAPRGCELSADPEGGPFAAVLDLAHSAAHSDPEPAMTMAFRAASIRSLHLLPVNLPLGPDGSTFRYKDYDSEYARGPASHDLQALARRLAPGQRVQVLDHRGGGRSLWETPPGHPEAPDGAVPMFLLQLEKAPLPPSPWLDRFQLPPDQRLKLVFVDSQNIAGSVLNHAAAVNRHTPHQALALCRRRHPYIPYPQAECRAVFTDEQGLTPTLQRELEEADAFVFFEDDDETRPVGPLALAPFVRGKRVVHLYIGQRVHRDTARHQRPGRTVLTPLPHLLRMFPGAHFYAGFPPITLEEVALRPPRSEQDGRIRILQTPSLPHPTLSQTCYHKDTESFLESARKLGRRTSAPVEPWLVAGWPHREVLEARLDCDITFNQLRGYHGLSGDEAMFLGRPLVQAFDQHNVNRHREYWGMDVEFPWVTTDPERLTDTLLALVEDRERREALGRASRQFMLDHFSPRAGILPLLWYCAQASKA